MASLTGVEIANSYQQLLQVGSNNIGLTTLLQYVQDGSGTNSALQLSNSTVNIDGLFQLNGVTLTATASVLNAVADLTGANGIIAVSAGQVYGRTLVAGGGLSITNGSGTEGNPTFSLNTTGVSAGSYGPVLNMQVNSYGQVTSVGIPSSVSITTIRSADFVGGTLALSSDASVTGTLHVAGGATLDGTVSAGGNLVVAGNVSANTIVASVVSVQSIYAVDFFTSTFSFTNVSVSSGFISNFTAVSVSTGALNAVTANLGTVSIATAINITSTLSATDAIFSGTINASVVSAGKATFTGTVSVNEIDASIGSFSGAVSVAGALNVVGAVSGTSAVFTGVVSVSVLDAVNGDFSGIVSVNGPSYFVSAVRAGSQGGTARPAFEAVRMGYSSSYRALIVGSDSTTYTTANTGAVTLAFNVDPSLNAGSQFNGTGGEFITRRGVTWLVGNAANTAWQQSYEVSAASFHKWYTDGGLQFQANETAGSTRAITVTGSNGGSPTLGTTAGGLNIAPTTALVSVSGGITVTGVVSGSSITLSGTINATMDSFSAYVSAATITSVTGNGAVYTLICDKETYDLTNAYNNATGVFTAGSAGLFDFNVAVNFTGNTATGLSVRLVTSNQTYRLWVIRPSNVATAGGDCLLSTALQVDMEAGDTAYVTVQGSGLPANSAGVYGGSYQNTYFQGRRSSIKYP